MREHPIISMRCLRQHIAVLTSVVLLMVESLESETQAGGRPCLFLLSRASSVIATPGPCKAEFLPYFNNQPPSQWLFELRLTCRQLPVGPSRRLHIVRAQDDEPFATAHQSTLSAYRLPILPSPALSRPRRLEPSPEDHRHN